MGEKPVTYRGTVYPWHCDQVGHMNVMWYVGKFDEGTWNFFTMLGLPPSYFRDKHRGMAAVRQDIVYRRELIAGDTVYIKTSMLETRDKVIRFGHEMFNAENDELCSFCELTGVHLDREARKSCPFPADVLVKAKEMIVSWPHHP